MTEYVTLVLTVAAAVLAVYLSLGAQLGKLVYRSFPRGASTAQRGEVAGSHGFRCWEIREPTEKDVKGGASRPVGACEDLLSPPE